MHLYIQIILAVKYKQAQIGSDWEPELHEFIRSICAKQRCNLLAVGGMPDHLHSLIQFTPSTVLEKLILDIQAQSADWINAAAFTSRPFEWQEGYTALSVGLRQLKELTNYINDQPSIHAQVSFLEEYEAILKAHFIDYDPNDIYQPLADY